jgi:hypothetical protein
VNGYENQDEKCYRFEVQMLNVHKLGREVTLWRSFRSSV